ncbi:MAG: cytochrome P450 [Methylobacter sp.]|nr:MAG: cytochrome P450 [Methylobacter sp.]
MSGFIPPYPTRHQKSLGPLDIIKHLRHNLLSIWPEKAFSRQFMTMKIINRSIFIANCPDAVQHVLVTNQANYEKKPPLLRKTLAPLLGNGLFLSDGGTWHKHSQLEKPLFGPEQIAQFSEVMAKTTRQWAERWASLPPQSTLPVLEEMQGLSATILCRILFGERFSDQQISQLIKAIATYQSAIEDIDLTAFFGLPSWIPSFGGNKPAKAVKTLHDLIGAAISASSPEDPTLVGHFLRLTDGNLDHQQIRNETITFFLAGYESAANTLAWAWYLIAQAPDVRQRLHQELDNVLDAGTVALKDLPKLPYTRAIVEETMRLYPPFPMLIREVSADDTIRGRPIPAGSVMLIVPWLLHRHTAYWDNPDHFMPERFLEDAPTKHDPFTYLPFSLGARECIAKYLGTVETTLCLALLARQFHLQTTPGQIANPICRLMLRPDNDMPMELVKR